MSLKDKNIIRKNTLVFGVPKPVFRTRHDTALCNTHDRSNTINYTNSNTNTNKNTIPVSSGRPSAPEKLTFYSYLQNIEKEEKLKLKRRVVGRSIPAKYSFDNGESYNNISATSDLEETAKYERIYESIKYHEEKGEYDIGINLRKQAIEKMVEEGYIKTHPDVLAADADDYIRRLNFYALRLVNEKRYREAEEYLQDAFSLITYGDISIGGPGDNSRQRYSRPTSAADYLGNENTHVIDRAAVNNSRRVSRDSTSLSSNTHNNTNFDGFRARYSKLCVFAPEYHLLMLKCYAVTENNKGICDFNAGRLLEAEEHFFRAAIMEQDLDQHGSREINNNNTEYYHRYVADNPAGTLFNLAQVQKALRKFKNSNECAKAAVAHLKIRYYHPTALMVQKDEARVLLLAALGLVAETYEELQKYKPALMTYDNAIAIASESYYSDRQATISHFKRRQNHCEAQAKRFVLFNSRNMSRPSTASSTLVGKGRAYGSSQFISSFQGSFDESSHLRKEAGRTTSNIRMLPKDQHVSSHHSHLQYNVIPTCDRRSAVLITPAVRTKHLFEPALNYSQNFMNCNPSPVYGGMTQMEDCDSVNDSANEAGEFNKGGQHAESDKLMKLKQYNNYSYYDIPEDSDENDDNNEGLYYAGPSIRKSAGSKQFHSDRQFDGNGISHSTCNTSTDLYNSTAMGREVVMPSSSRYSSHLSYPSGSAMFPVETHSYFMDQPRSIKEQSYECDIHNMSQTVAPFNSKVPPFKFGLRPSSAVERNQQVFPGLPPRRPKSACQSHTVSSVVYDRSNEHRNNKVKLPLSNGMNCESNLHIKQTGYIQEDQNNKGCHDNKIQNDNEVTQCRNTDNYNTTLVGSSDSIKKKHTTDLVKKATEFYTMELAAEILQCTGRGYMSRKKTCCVLNALRLRNRLKDELREDIRIEEAAKAKKKADDILRAHEHKLEIRRQAIELSFGTGCNRRPPIDVNLSNHVIPELLPSPLFAEFSRGLTSLSHHSSRPINLQMNPRTNSPTPLLYGSQSVEEKYWNGLGEVITDAHSPLNDFLGVKGQERTQLHASIGPQSAGSISSIDIEEAVDVNMIVSSEKSNDISVRGVSSGDGWNTSTNIDRRHSDAKGKDENNRKASMKSSVFVEGLRGIQNQKKEHETQDVQRKSSDVIHKFSKLTTPMKIYEQINDASKFEEFVVIIQSHLRCLNSQLHSYGQKSRKK